MDKKMLLIVAILATVTITSGTLLLNEGQAEDSAIHVGDEVVVSIPSEGCNDVKSGLILFEYDVEVLKFIEGAWNIDAIMKDVSDGEGVFAVAGPASIPSNDDFLELRFECLAEGQASIAAEFTFKTSSGEVVESVDPITITVSPEQKPYRTVSYDLAGGSGSISSTTVQEGSSFTLDTYTGIKSGYVFGGWSYEGKTYQPGTSMTMGDSDMTFTAVWDSYSVSVGAVKKSTSVRVTVQLLEGDAVQDGKVTLNYTYTAEKMSFGKIRVVTYSASMDPVDIKGGSNYSTMKLNLGDLEHYSQIKTLWAVYSTDLGDCKSSAIVYSPYSG